jgi:hypothetical protein
VNWIERLRNRWQVKNTRQVLIILLVFACTGYTVVAISKPILQQLFQGQIPFWARVVYYILILPIYNLFLLLYGFIFGQFTFFWSFEKRVYHRIFGSSQTKP